MASSVTVSAPGKVLLAGGYLVLDRRHTGLVFGLDARIYVAAQAVPPDAATTRPAEIMVRSPQFRHAEWRYRYHIDGNGGGVRLEPVQKNTFVETALSYALTYVSLVAPTAIEPCSITILADDDYYSPPETLSRTAASRTAASRAPTGQRVFARFDVPINEAHKTGLGSSAALVTAFTAAVLAHYLTPERWSLATADGKRRLHNLAQVAHCAAQGKVGSGFDVAAAVYGSCLYRRFSPGILQGLAEAGTMGFARQMVDTVDDTTEPRRWDTQIDGDSISMPQGLRLVMCDVDCGSQSVGMAKKVLSWRTAHPEDAALIWQELQGRNDKLRASLSALDSVRRQDPSRWEEEIDAMLRTPDTLGRPAAWWQGHYRELRETVAEIRRLLRDMSVRSDVPIEPPTQTALLDRLTSLPGVLCGLVPGAGGFDAIALVVVDRDEVMTRLHRLAETYGAQEKIRLRLLGVRESMEGIRFEGEQLHRLQ